LSQDDALNSVKKMDPAEVARQLADLPETKALPGALFPGFQLALE
jgi:hypothetical protein